MMQPTQQPMEGQEEEAPNVTPEEQEAYNTVVEAALSMIYVDDGSFDQILQKIQGEAEGDGLAYGIGHTAAMILRSIQGSAKQAGREVPEDVLLPAGQEIVSELVSVCIKAGLAKQEDEENLIAEAVMNGVQEFGKAALQAGEISPEQQAEAKSEFEALKGGQPAPQQPQSIVAATKGMQP